MKEITENLKFEHQSDFLAKISSDSGVYLMKDFSGKVIYVGKARNLRKRISSYFSRPEIQDIKTSVLVKKISSIDTIITSTEKEALILESTLIKKHRPRYNVILKDDKRYPSLRLDMTSPYPNLAVVRKTAKDGAIYFGPYTSSSAVYETLRIIKKTFKLRKCHNRVFNNRSRPCLNYQIGACLGPCCNKVDPDLYKAMVKDITLFLRGKTPELIQKLKHDMTVAASETEYETAAEIRDKIFAIEKTLEKQIVITADFLDRDIIGMARSKSDTLITVLSVRAGHLAGSKNYHFSETLATDSELMGSFIHQFYETATVIPDEVLSSTLPDGADAIQELLTGIKKGRVAVIWPKRGIKSHLIQMAEQNARNELDHIINDRLNDQGMLIRLQKQLNLSKLPSRIECFDNSNISGSDPVAGMVVFENAKPKKSNYRKYKIRTISEPDDYATMAEVLKRRYGKGKNSEPFPDLLMVDGGKGQLGIAMSVLDDLDLTGRFDVIGIAKKDEKKGQTADKIYKYGRANPFDLDRDENVLIFLQRIRDEAHRFAITYHRSKRSSSAVCSVLDEIPGVGAKMKQVLLKNLGSINNIRKASLDELCRLPGMNKKTAEAVQDRLKNTGINTLTDDS